MISSQDFEGKEITMFEVYDESMRLRMSLEDIYWIYGLASLAIRGESILERQRECIPVFGHASQGKLRRHPTFSSWW